MVSFMFMTVRVFLENQAPFGSIENFDGNSGFMSPSMGPK
jgi:hypothetical protein